MENYARVAPLADLTVKQRVFTSPHNSPPHELTHDVQKMHGPAFNTPSYFRLQSKPTHFFKSPFQALVFLFLSLKNFESIPPSLLHCSKQASCVFVVPAHRSFRKTPPPSLPQTSLKRKVNVTDLLYSGGARLETRQNSGLIHERDMNPSIPITGSLTRAAFETNMYEI